MADKLSLHLTPSRKTDTGFGMKSDYNIKTDTSRSFVNIERNGNIMVSYDVEIDKENNIHFMDVQKNDLVNQDVIDNLYLDCEKIIRIYSMENNYLDNVHFFLTLDQENGSNPEKYRKFLSSLKKFYESMGGEFVGSSKIDKKTTMYKLKIPRQDIFRE